MTRSLSRHAILFLGMLTLALTFVVSPLAGAPVQAQSITKYVATTGNDANPGTLDKPFRTVTKGLRSMLAGQTLLVRGGTYTERVTGFTLPAGTSTARITVKAYPGERPVVQGLLWLKEPKYWTFDGINVTWNAATNLANEHMVKLTSGNDWVFTNAEIWGARSFAAILITGTPASYTLSHLNVHDTYAANGQWQDHLIYVNSYAGGTGGVIERNLLWNSANGRAIKVGPSSSSSTTPVGNVTIRYNTMFNNMGPTNINLSHTAANVRIERNILQRVGERQANIDATSLTGKNNIALNNVGWESARVVVTGFAGLTDGGGNLFLNPQFTSLTTPDLRPLEIAAQGYGRYAP